MGIRFILMVNKQGQTRLAQYYEWLTLEERRALEGEIVRKCLARNEQQCSFVEHRNYKIVYRRYASLFFLVGVDNDEVDALMVEILWRRERVRGWSLGLDLKRNLVSETERMMSKECLGCYPSLALEEAVNAIGQPTACYEQCNLWRSEDTLKYFLVLDRAVELDGFGSKSGLCACWPVGLNCNKDNELAILEFIHLLVETMDRHFGNVCELDIMFHLEKAHFMLEEMVMNGSIVETSKANILSPIQLMDKAS
ncbi:hypothetical protein Godav_001747 [Gossypium davidsonii]|uniref:AP complex mu/sigma subunit domain-containing protein n=1 Tax=Gossypium davidsonii TaxID=34287 RepID=A0A7J8T3Y2_GOSDV|nr:hypothetical protein [Gossypium davidsonii]